MENEEQFQVSQNELDDNLFIRQQTYVSLSSAHNSTELIWNVVWIFWILFHPENRAQNEM